jgi:hypothetical protein
MDVRPLLIELLVSGFFATACLKARAGDFNRSAFSPREFFKLLPRLERLRRTRWQWFSMVLLLFVIRKQIGVPVVVEFTALAQFLIFLMLPVAAEGGGQLSGGRTVDRASRPKMRMRAAVR